MARYGATTTAVTRDLEWGIQVPLEGEDWQGKCIYVWFEAVQGYLTCSQIWSESFGDESSWENWWLEDSNKNQRHFYFLGKDNVPFHTVIWPAILMGLNHVRNGKTANDPISLPTAGDLRLEDNVPAMEYLMLAGGQFSKSRKHAIWLPSFLERFDPDTLRYYLSINMPESHDTDFHGMNLLIESTMNLSRRMETLQIVYSLYLHVFQTLLVESNYQHLIQLKHMQNCVQRSKRCMGI